MNKEHLHPEGRPYTKEEFVTKIKTDKKFAKRFGNLGPIYGKQWRSWETDEEYFEIEGDDIPENIREKYIKVKYTRPKQIDQIANLIHDLKVNPDSRRLMVSAWNPSDLEASVLPPCHYGFQVYTRELDIEYRAMLSGEFNENTLRVDQFIEMYGMRLLEQKLDEYNIPKRAISLQWSQRSVDSFLGLPFNIASYGLLLEIISKAVNMVPDELIGNLGDTHLYLDHIEQAKEQIGEIIYEESPIFYPFGTKGRGVQKKTPIGRTREPYPLPTLKHMKSDEFYKSLSEDLSLLTHLDNTDFVVENYQSHPAIKAPLSN